MKETILWGIKKGNPAWMQEIITNDKRNFEKARAWAKRNGFDRFRVAEIDTSKAPELLEQCKLFEKVLSTLIIEGDSGADLERDNLQAILDRVEGETV